ncbi:hypothetical protein [Candidatus Protochlamydia phocaeensis]|uniref:hypothetical protein n=1 Tax=Candidatus Protochlamydia phocaeensis TaxID=1414722 RepID=UPI000838220C|nr:hypothetical protein [Candidatus Protochlamydia phocaeensis]
MNSIHGNYHPYNPGNFYPHINYPHQNSYSSYVSNPYGGHFFHYPIIQPRIPTVEDFENSFYRLYASIADKKGQWESHVQANAGTIEKVQMLQAGIKELQEELGQVQQLDAQIKVLRPENLYQQEFRYQIEIDPTIQNVTYYSYVDYVQQKKSELIEQIYHLAQHTISWLSSSRQTVYHLKQAEKSSTLNSPSYPSFEPSRIQARQLPHPEAFVRPSSAFQPSSLPINNPSPHASISPSEAVGTNIEPKPLFKQVLADLIQRQSSNHFKKTEASAVPPSSQENSFIPQPSLSPLRERVKVHHRPLPPVPAKEEKKTPPPLPPRERKRTPPPLPPRSLSSPKEATQEPAGLALPPSIIEGQAIGASKISLQQALPTIEQPAIEFEDKTSVPAIVEPIIEEQTSNRPAQLESARKTVEIGQDILHPQSIPTPPPFIQLFSPQSRHIAETKASEPIATEQTDGVFDLLSSQLAARRQAIEEESEYESDDDSIDLPKVSKPETQSVQSLPSSVEERPTINRYEDRSDLLSSIVNFNKNNLKKLSEESPDRFSQAEKKDDPSKAGTDFASLMQSIIDRLPDENDTEEVSDIDWE